MKKIKLTQNKFAIVDKKDFPRVSKYKWLAHKTRGGIWYAENHTSKNGKKIITYLHRFILKVPKNMEVDHKNRNPLDNRRKNLLITTRKFNLINRRKLIHKNKSSRFSKFKGVFRNKSGTFTVILSRNKKQKYIGTYKNELEAKKAWELASTKDLLLSTGSTCTLHNNSI